MGLPILLRQVRSEALLLGERTIRGVVRGGGGTGKSHTINCLRRWLSEQPEISDDAIMVLAPTGCAAFNVAGRTLHSALAVAWKTGLVEEAFSESFMV